MFSDAIDARLRAAQAAATSADSCLPELLLRLLPPPRRALPAGV
ncbi:hypothetical protein [Hymenobacter jeollabukensis]|nr:hypothetical protein [Hymenobacter jeollabukensis]